MNRSRSSWILYRRVFGAAALALLACGCVERLLKVRSDPPEARVFVEGEEVGETPLDHPFSFYGTVKVVLRRDDHLSARIIKPLDPPWYQFFPLDFFAECVVPWSLEDHHEVEATLERLPEEVDSEVEEDLERRAAAASGEAADRAEGTRRAEEEEPDAPRPAASSGDGPNDPAD